MPEPPEVLAGHTRARETAGKTIVKAVCARCAGTARAVANVHDSKLGAVWVAAIPYPDLARVDAADRTHPGYGPGQYPTTTNTWLVERPAGEFAPQASCEVHGILTVDPAAIRRAVAEYRATGRVQKIPLE